MRHMGNVQAAGRTSGEQLDHERGENVTELDGWLDTTPYLLPTSDLVAMMVLEHQTRMLTYPCSWLIYSDSFDQLPEPVY